MAKTFLIDENGEIDIAPAHQMLVGGTVASRARIKTVETGQIVWLGGKSGLSIYFRPAVTNILARQRILSWLVSVAPQRVHIAYWARNAWHHEICGSASVARDRIYQIFSASCSDDGVRVGRRIKTQREVKGIKVFNDAVEFWKEHNDRFVPELHFHALREISAEQANLFQVGRFDSFVPLEMRAGLSPGFAKWFSSNHGAPISAFPDGVFARSLAQAFSSADICGVPSADEIDAFARWPGQSCRFRYHRLILPLWNGDNRWIVSMSIFDNELDLHD